MACAYGYLVEADRLVFSVLIDSDPLSMGYKELLGSLTAENIRDLVILFLVLAIH